MAALKNKMEDLNDSAAGQIKRSTVTRNKTKHRR